MSDEILASLLEIARAVMTVVPERSLPRPGETAAVSLLHPKIAALAYDRVWSAAAPDTPESIGFFGGADAEIELTTLRILYNFVRKKIGDPSYSFTWSDAKDLNVFMAQRATLLDPTAALPLWIDDASEALSRIFATAHQALHGIHSVPIYSTTTISEREYTVGNVPAVVSIVSGLDVVDERHLSWNQALELRKDSEARRKYRRFVHWLDSEMAGKPESFIQDAISERLDDYRWVIRKHGLSTALGSLTAILDARSLATAAASSLAVAHFASDLAGLVAGAGILIGRVAVTAATAMLNLEDLRRTTRPEVAFIHELGKKAD